MEGCMGAFANRNPVELSQGLALLKEEHPPLIQLLDELVELSKKVEDSDQKQDVFAILTEKVKAFFSKLERHSEKEEGILFKMMEVYLGKGTGPIAVMEHEHEQAKSMIRGFLNKTEGDGPLSTEEMHACTAFIRKAYSILVDHFAKEENVLYPMAENLFTKEEKELLYERVQS
ncbi:hemerythrin domain-containing protein [Bacillus canaveralius]|uniref:hemerythrin domain-containing protein n=1 Tax=Bacillus canaveralius TaxID=1403243 RepID=UPI000F77DC5E|nr:hemerythrin domain-containing protein [Bacillus canaveralius]RSK52357.1 hemerythrin domain-containing protein [Bacillus canaveralius]